MNNFIYVLKLTASNSFWGFWQAFPFLQLSLSVFCFQFLICPHIPAFLLHDSCGLLDSFLKLRCFYYEVLYTSRTPTASSLRCYSSSIVSVVYWPCAVCHPLQLLASFYVEQEECYYLDHRQQSKLFHLSVQFWYLVVGEKGCQRCLFSSYRFSHPERFWSLVD